MVPRERLGKLIPLWDFLVIEFGGLIEIKRARLCGAGNLENGSRALG